MEQLGNYLSTLGLEFLPLSFSMYFPVRWLEHIWKKGYTRLIKAIWYFALGITYVTNGLEIDQIVTYICFIEAWDLLFQQLEVNNDRKTKNS